MHIQANKSVLRDLPTPDQLEILLPRLRRCRNICLDYTGPGVGLGDEDAWALIAGTAPVE